LVENEEMKARTEECEDYFIICGKESLTKNFVHIHISKKFINHKQSPKPFTS
jgi:hypothetical protein